MVRDYRKAVEKMYIGRMNVVEYQDVVMPNFSTQKQEVTVITNEPCRVSFSTFANAGQSDTTTAISQQIRVFCAPENDIKAGSKLIIEQNGVTTSYRATGVSAMHEGHQEINVILFDRWA